MDSIEAALAALDLQSKPNYTQTAEEYGVDRTTLSRRHRNITGSRADGYDSLSFLTKEQSKVLVNYVNDLTNRGLPPTVAMLRNFAQEIAGKQPGSRWAARWIEKQGTSLKSHYLTPINNLRKKAESAYHFGLYFSLLAQKIKKYGIKRQNTYNMDEKGFLISMLTKLKRVFSRAAFKLGRVKDTIQDGNRE